MGWRLPSVVELKSLQDGSPGAVAPFVPASAFTIGGSPGVQTLNYWSSTTHADNSAVAWVVPFFFSDVFILDKATIGILAWCVRGGMNADAY